MVWYNTDYFAYEQEATAAFRISILLGALPDWDTECGFLVGDIMSKPFKMAYTRDQWLAAVNLSALLGLAHIALPVKPKGQ